MRDEEGQLEVPEFKPEIPEHLIAKLSPAEKWQYENSSVNSQQIKWLIERAVRMDRKRREDKEDAERLHKEDQDAREKLTTRVDSLETFKNSVTSKWSVVAGLASLIGIPLLITWLSTWISSKSGK